MRRRPPKSTRTDTSFPTRRSSDLIGDARARDHPHHAAGNDGDLRRAGAGVAADAIGDFHYEFDAAGHLKRRCKDHKGEDRAGGKLGQAAEQAAEIRNRGITDQEAQADAAVIEQALRHQIAKIAVRSEEHTSELQSLMRRSYAVLCLKKNKIN